MARGKFTKEQKRLIEEQLEAGIPVIEIAKFVSEATGKAITGKQVNGYKNVWSGVAGTKGRDPTQQSPGGGAGMDLPPGAPPPQKAEPTLEAATVQTTAESAAPATDGFEPAGARQADDGFPTQKTQMRIEFDIHRKEPNNGYLGRVNSPFGLQELGRQLGDGLYDIDKLVNGRNIGRYPDQRVSGFGPPKFLDGRPAAPGGGGYGMPQVAIENAYGQRYPGQYGYMPGMGPTAIPQDPTAQFRNLHEVADKMAQRMTPPQQDNTHATAVQASFQFAQALMQKQDSSNGAQGGWFQQHVAQQASDRAQERRDDILRGDRQREDAKTQRSHDLQMAKDQHRMDMDRQKQDFEQREASAKVEFERRKDQDQQFQQTLRSIEGDRAKDQEARVNRVETAAKETQEAVSKELNDNVETIKTFYEGIHTKDQENVEAQRQHNKEMYELQMKHMESQNSNGLLGSTIKDVAERIGNVTDRAITLRAIDRMSPEARELLKNTNFLNGNKSSNGNGNANATPAISTSAGGGEVEQEQSFGQAQVDKVLKSEFFKTLQEEWALDIQAGRGATMFTHAFLTYMKTSANMVMFAKYMTARTWEKMLKVMDAHLNDEVRKVFSTKEAADFFEDFCTVLVSNVRYSLEYAKKAVEVMQKKQAEPAAPTS